MGSAKIAPNPQPTDARAEAPRPRAARLERVVGAANVAIWDDRTGTRPVTTEYPPTETCPLDGATMFRVTSPP